MIRVNLGDHGKRKVAVAGAVGSASSSSGVSAKSASRAQRSFSLLPLIHLLLIGGTVLGAYVTYAGLSAEGEALEADIRVEEDRRRKLDVVIKQDQVYESRKKMLEARLRVVRSLRSNQVSPVVSLDKISDAISRTNRLERNPYVWLNRLEQNNATFSMSGVATSVLGIADLMANLEGTGYFKNIVQFNAQDSAGNYNFTLNCEYAPPRKPTLGKLSGAN
jgi:Tfp pilus assembly protein PilN